MQSNPHLRDQERALLLEHGPKGIEYRLSQPERIIEANDAARRAKGTRESAKARAKKNTKRNRKIHDANAIGTTPKQIAGDPKIRGKKKLRESQIRRILKAPRP